MGVDRDGAFAEYLCIPARNVIALSEDVVAFFAAFGNATRTSLMWNLVGEDVLITDLNDYRLDLACKMGMDAAVNTATEDLKDVMKCPNIVQGFAAMDSGMSGKVILDRTTKK